MNNDEIIIKLNDHTIYCTLEQFMMLSERERKVLELRLGLNGNEKNTLKKVGEMIENRRYKGKPLSKERVRSLQAVALRKLRHPLRHIKCVWNNENEY
jgi:RNA polymerase primary sigma factor